MKREVAQRTMSIKYSGIRAVSDKVEELRKNGHVITDLTIGRPNFDTPSHIKDAAKKAIDEGKVHYTSNYGIIQLREAISKKLHQDNDLQYNPDEIIVTAGGEEALAIAFMSYINPGDEVIVPEPCFVGYATLIKLCGGIPVYVSTKDKDSFRLPHTKIEEAISPRTKAIVFASPNNPTGIMMSKEDLQFLADIAKKYNLLIITDEVYEKILFDNNQNISIGSLSEMRDYVITCNSLSKTYSMTGWRLGYLAADKELIQPMVKVHQGLVTCANSVAQWAALEAVTASQKCVEDMNREYEERRKFLIESFGKFNPLRLVVPDGSIFACVDIQGTGMTSFQAMEYFLNNSGVAMVPGDAFGPSGEGFLRLSFGCSLKTLEEAAERISRVLHSW